MKRPRRRPKTLLALALALMILAWGSIALAQDSSRPKPAFATPLRDHRADESLPKSLRVGAIGGVGFPEPLSIEGMGMIDGTVALGAEFGALPTTAIAGVQTSLWALAGDVRLFPFRARKMPGAINAMPVRRIMPLQFREAPAHSQSAEHLHVSIRIRLERIQQSPVPVEKHIFNQGWFFCNHSAQV